MVEEYNWNFILAVGVIQSLLLVVILCIVLFTARKKYIKNKRYIEQLEAKTSRLKSELNEKDLNIESLTMELHDKNNSLENILEHNKLLQRQALSAAISLNAQEIMDKIILASEGRYSLEADDWVSLLLVIDAQYPDFNDIIHKKLRRPTIHLIRTCYLLKAGMSPSQIERIMDVPHQTAWYRVQTVNKALHDDIVATRVEQV